MGIIQRQTIKNNLVAVLSTLVGLAAVVSVYPLDLEAKGLADGMVYYATLLFPFFTLGAGLVMVRIIPNIRATPEKAKSQVLSWSIAAVSAFLLLFGLFFWLAQDRLLAAIAGFGYETNIVADYSLPVYIVLACLALSCIANTNLINHNRIAVPAIFNSLLLKLGLPLLVLGSYYRIVDHETFAWCVGGLYLASTLGVVMYSIYIGAFKLDFSPVDLGGFSLWRVAEMGAFSIFGMIGNSAVTGGDIVLVTSLLGLEATAIYTFGIFAAGLMYIPYRAINSIVIPQVVQAWKDNDIAHVDFLYKESSLVLTTIAGTLVIGMVFCLPPFYLLTENLGKYAPGYGAAIFLGVGVFFDLLASINSSIINYSDYFRWNILFVLVAGGLNFACSWLFMSVYGLGLLGAGIGSCISIIIYNAIKLGFVYKKAGIHPFRINHVYVIALFVAIALVTMIIPSLANPYLTLLTKGGFIVSTMALMLYFTPIVPPIRKFLREDYRKLF